MSNNAISRTGTFTSSGSAGGQGTYDYSGTSGYSGIDYYSNDDLKNGSIFTDIDNKISITFSQEIDDTSVKTFNKDTDLPLDLQNQKGTIGLSHVVTGVTGETSDGNSLQALKLTSEPNPVYSEISLAEFVEMSSIAETDDNITYKFTPKVNLSSNTTYFLRIDTDNVFDVSGAVISYTTEKGFVTDNTKSFVTTTDYYEGFSMQTENSPLLGEEVSPDPDTESHPKFDSEDTMSLYRADGTASDATALKILSIDGTQLTYQLEPISYRMNVSYTATNPVVITNINHNLIDDDKIQVYDVVSGNVVSIGEYTITEITSDLFSIPVDGTGSDAGALNYYRNVNKNDLLVWSEADTPANPLLSATTYTIRKKVLSVPQKKTTSTDTLSKSLNNTFSTIKDSTSVASTAKGKIIKFTEGGTISYVPVDSTGKITTDVFVNNSIVDISTSNKNIRFHIKANTSPDHNVHPFHSSAPKVISTFPEEGGSFPRKLTITQITRKGAIAHVNTNHPHNLSIGSFIKIVDSTQSVYNKTKNVLFVPTANTFTYDLGASTNFLNVQSPAPGNPKLQISYDDGATYAERYNAIIVNFSQSMNTSTVTIANNTHLISADGTSAVFTGDQDSASSTIQISDDGFETIENCVSVTVSTGNSVFAVVPETLKREHRYKIKAKTGIQDLGHTNSLYEFATTEGIATGLVVRDPVTGKEIIYSKDEDPPKIKKISIDTTVLESSDLSEITSPNDYQALTFSALNTHGIKIQFSESMKIDSVTTATTSTSPTGTIQLSSDNFNTVVQMATDPVVTTTDEDNDTFTVKPIANVSANTTYTLKVFKGVRDASAEQNQMAQDNVSSVKVLTTHSIPGSSDNYYVPGETISGVRTLTIKANTGTPTIGLALGSTFLGLTSKGKGKVLDLTEDSGAIKTIRYTELAGNDGSIKPLTPGEICKVSDTVNFTIDNVAITDPPEGNVVSFTTGTKKLVYRDNNLDNEFISGNSSAERIFGRTSLGEVYASSTGTSGIVGEGFKTTTTAITANVFFSKDSVLVSPIDQNQIGIDENSNLTVTFNQTMNVESINFNAVDSFPRDTYNILLSYDDGFQNTIPLSTTFTTSNNDTTFEFQPSILSNTSLQLTQDMNLYAKVTQTAKNLGDMNLASVFAPSNYANTVTDVDFKAINASVYTADGQELELGLGDSGAGNMPSQSSVISVDTPIIIHFNEVPLKSSFALDSEIELGTVADFTSGTVAIGNGALTSCGRYGTQIKIQLGASLSSSTQYFLRVGATVGGTNEGGKALTATITWFNSFTTA